MANVGVVGATGLVGTLIGKILEERNFPIDNLRLFASARSAGRTISFAGRDVVVEAANTDFAGLDVVLMSAGGQLSRELAPVIAKAGAVVIDNSSAWRMDPQVPLVVTEVNGHEVQNAPLNIIANPNCTTMVAMPVLKPLHDQFGLKRLIASSYQAVSGSGVKGVNELREQAMKVSDDFDALLRSGDSVPQGNLYPEPIAYNVIPMTVNLIDEETDEEHKFRDETRKILSLPEVSVHITCVRVPVVAGHSLSIAVTFEHETSAMAAIEVLADASGVLLTDVPTPLRATGGNVSLVGRLRGDIDDPHTLHLFVSGDNLRKGAALNAVQIAELVVGG